MPYVMLQGIRKKAKQRAERQAAMEAEAGVVTGKVVGSARRASSNANRASRSGGERGAGSGRCVRVVAVVNEAAAPRASHFNQSIRSYRGLHVLFFFTYLREIFLRCQQIYFWIELVTAVKWLPPYPPARRGEGTPLLLALVVWPLIWEGGSIYL